LLPNLIFLKTILAESVGVSAWTNVANGSFSQLIISIGTAALSAWRRRGDGNYDSPIKIIAVPQTESSNERSNLSAIGCMSKSVRHWRQHRKRYRTHPKRLRPKIKTRRKTSLARAIRKTPPTKNVLAIGQVVIDASRHRPNRHSKNSVVPVAATLYDV